MMTQRRKQRARSVDRRWMVCRATDADSEENGVVLENNGRAMEKTRNMFGVPRRR